MYTVVRPTFAASPFYPLLPTGKFYYIVTIIQKKQLHQCISAYPGIKNAFTAKSSKAEMPAVVAKSPQRW